MEVSIITINYNSSIFTVKLVNSILEKVNPAIQYEVIIVDNASNKKDYERLISNLPADDRIKVQRNQVNNGFSGGNMDGYEQSLGQYLLFINNDCVCKNDVVSPLISFLQENRNIGLLTGKVRGKDGKYSSTHKLFPSFIKSVLGNQLVRLISKHNFISPKEEIMKPTKVQVVTGAFMFFERNVFSEINGFDKIFFLYCEEEDISKRVWDSGREVYFLPQPEIIHEHGGSCKPNDKNLRNEYYISYKKLIFKHYNFFYSLLMMFMVYLKILKNLFSGKSDLELLLLAIKGFPEKSSLRYKQKA